MIIVEQVNWKAVERYRHIMQRVLDHGMKVMLTLFHHSLPIWAADYGGWKEAKTIKYFLDFTRLGISPFTCCSFFMWPL
jgi:beta-glucosidase/6-phospho-beta-glucosidase/beta-galactosidase